MTLNQIVSSLETIASNHLLINTFGFGDLWEVASSGDITYPLMWAVLDGVDISTKDKTEIYKFSLLFMDAVKGGEVNETEVLSDQLSTAKDVLAQLKHPTYIWAFQDNVSSLEDFTERFVDSVAGWKMNVELKLPFTSNRCAAPYSGTTTAPNICPPVVVNYYLDAVLQSSETYSTTSGYECIDITVNYYIDSVLQTTSSLSGGQTETITLVWQ